MGAVGEEAVSRKIIRCIFNCTVTDKQPLVALNTDTGFEKELSRQADKSTSRRGTG